MAKLNAKQQAFVAAYAKCKNATKAAIAAGYSKRSAKTIGPRLLENVDISRAIDKLLSRALEKAELTITDVLKELRAVAFAKLPDAYDDEGILLKLHEMPDDVKAALHSLESDEIVVGRGSMRKIIGYNRKLKFADKLKALELIGKHFKMFTDVTELKGGVQVTTSLKFPPACEARLQEGMPPPPQPEKKKDGDGSL